MNNAAHNTNEAINEIADLLNKRDGLIVAIVEEENRGELAVKKREALQRFTDEIHLNTAVAQAMSLARIADCLEALTDERTASIELAKAEATIAAQEHEIEQLNIINRELGEDDRRMEAKLRELNAWP